MRIDIATDLVQPAVRKRKGNRRKTNHLLQDYKKETDPSLYSSVKTGRGPLGKHWIVSEIISGASGSHLELSARNATINVRLQAGYAGI